MQYIVIITRTEDVDPVAVVGRWSMPGMAEDWVSENQKPGYDYTVMKMYHHDLYQ